MAQTLTVVDGETLDTGSETVEMLTVESGGTLNVNPAANFNLTGALPTTIDNAGVINTGANTDFQFARGVSNSGAINVNSSTTDGFAADIELTGETDLTGGGTISLSGNNAGITGITPGLDLNIVDQTIQGDGAVGRNFLDINNNGLIDANVTGQSILIDTNVGGLTNTGTVQASNGGTLAIQSSNVDNAGGTITAQTGSTVLLDSGTSITGGTVSSVGTGEVRTVDGSNVFLTDVTTSGSLVAGNNSDLGIEGTITNSGDIGFDSTTNFQADLEVQADGATLTGGGTVTLSGVNAGINSISSGSDLIIDDQTIQGDGAIGRNLIDITINAGATIDANVTGETIFVDPSGSGPLTSDGTLSASNGGIIDFNSDVISNGRIELDNGTFTANSLISSIDSVISGNGILIVDDDGPEIAGLLAPGDDLSAGTIELDSLFLSSDSTLGIDLFGATEFDSVVVNSLGESLVSGNLAVSLLGGFTPGATDVFEFLSINLDLGAPDSPIDFANVAIGDRILTSDGGGSFLVELTGTGVQLTNFEAVPEPGTLSFAIAIAGGIFLRRRRKS